jgi:anti-sigma factor RsiW
VNCQQFVELVTAYLEDQLPVRDRADFEEHLRMCPGCDRYLEQFRTTISALGELPERSISATARDTLLDAFAEWRGGSGRR